jgi:hypothetical protein
LGLSTPAPSAPANTERIDETLGGVPATSPPPPTPHPFAPNPSPQPPANTERIDEILEEDEDKEDLVAHQGARRGAAGAFRREKGSLAAASGAGRAAYDAWARGGGRRGRGGRGAKRQLTQGELERRDKMKKMRSKLAS